ncbi:MAG: hypothetical protein WC935_08725 [Thermoleophilia bacterium]
MFQEKKTWPYIQDVFEDGILEVKIKGADARGHRQKYRNEHEGKEGTGGND